MSPDVFLLSSKTNIERLSTSNRSKSTKKGMFSELHAVCDESGQTCRLTVLGRADEQS